MACQSEGRKDFYITIIAIVLTFALTQIGSCWERGCARQEETESIKPALAGEITIISAQLEALTAQFIKEWSANQIPKNITFNQNPDFIYPHALYDANVGVLGKLIQNKRCT